jgi:hypothetical protein
MARAAGIVEDKLIYLYCGAAANDPRDYLERAELGRSHALEAVLEAVVNDVGGDARAFSAVELYSCFPIVPKSALRILGMPYMMPTVTGGLSFFGAPFNNHMTHAAVAMVRRLRKEHAASGLLYGNGGFMAYHHALVLTSDPSKANGKLTQDYRVQGQADARRLPIPRIAENYAGAAEIETFTVVYGRDGAPTHATVIGRTPGNERVLARVPGVDKAAIARLLDSEMSPVGLNGSVEQGEDALLVWKF